MPCCRSSVRAETWFSRTDLCSGCIAKYRDNPVTALDRYETARRERTTNVVQRSAGMAATFHNDALSAPETGASYISSNWHPDKLRTRYDTIYMYDAINVPI